MLTGITTISPESSLMRCADTMIEHQYQRIPVVEKTGRVVRIVHLRGFYLAITDLMCGVK